MPTRFTADERAIEGLPIRLVIAVAVGVAALGIMLGMLDGVDEFGDTEVTVQMSDELVVLSEGETVEVSVTTENGRPVSDAQLLVLGGSAPLANGPVVLATGEESNTAVLSVGEGGTEAESDGHAAVAFRDGQARGTLSIEVVPPSGSDLVDAQSNPELVVVRG